MPFRLLLVSAGLSAALVTPALAAWDRVGSVDIDYRLERTSQYGGFEGPVEKLQLRAAGNDVSCRTVSAQFGNGQTANLWHGALRDGRPQNIDVPAIARDLRQVQFVCLAVGNKGARIEIYADTSGWDAGRPASSGWVPPSADVSLRPPVQPPTPGWNENDWIALGSARFASREDETTVNGANGRHFQQVGLRARGNNGQCRAVVIRFTNGEKVSLSVNGGQIMREDRLYQVELPGWRRNILRLALACRAVRSDFVSIQVYASR